MNSQKYLLIGIPLCLLMLWAFGTWISNCRALSKAQTAPQQAASEQRAELLIAAKNHKLIVLMAHMLEKVDDELKDNPTRTLSEATIGRIAALSNACEPSRYMVGDSLSREKLSLERGQLFLSLAIMDIDSSSFDKVKAKASFAEADLRNADLRGTNLSGANLQGANLSTANLSEADLREVDLRKANLWGTNLVRADLRKADLKRANAAWADLNGADLRAAVLDGADLRSAKLKKADLRLAKVFMANLSGAFFIEANLAGADLFWTDFTRTNFSKANMIDVNLRRTNLTEANFSEVELTNTSVEEKDWLQKLTEWRVTGATEIQATYKMIPDTTGRSKFQLIQKN